MTDTTFSALGAAVVQAGSPAIVALALYEADGTTPQDLSGRRFSYSVWRPGSGAVVGDFVAAGEDAVTEDGRQVLKLGPTGEDTSDWAAGAQRVGLAWAIYELTEAGPVIWWPADGRPGPYTVMRARDPALDFPAGAGGGVTAPYAVISLAGQAGGATVLAVTAQGAAGASAKAVAIAAGALPEDATDEDFAAWLREDAEAAAADATAAAASATSAAASATSAAASATSAAGTASSAATAATTAAGQANTARDAANSAASAATSAASAANTAHDDAEAAAAAATSAAAAATTAASSANSAASSATSAASSATTAATSANTAASAANAAKTAADTATTNANTAATQANTARDGANSAASAATTAAGSATSAATSATSAAAAANAAAATALDLTPVDISGTTYTAQASDNGKVLSCSNAAGCTITLPNSLAVGWNVIVCQAAAGQVTLSAAAGATLRQASALTKTRAQWSELGLRVRANAGGAAAEYVASGDMA